MNNYELFDRDPRTSLLANDGVARVSEPGSEKEIQVLREELGTFVCEGEYAKGIADVIHSFLTNLNHGTQPGVWVSGFYGSGKSHFSKMLRALWVDFQFPSDGARASGIVSLPDDVKAPLRELSVRATQLGVKTHAASGTLSAGAGSKVRTAILMIVFRSLGFASNLGTARFELWLREAGYLDTLRAAVEKANKRWTQERDHFLVSPIIASALLGIDPSLAENVSKLRDRLQAQFPPSGADVGTEEMIETIRRALAKADGALPLTLLVLDEVQQFIGEDPNRTMEVQDAVEALQRSLDGRVIVVGTGQSALKGTPVIEKLQARFTLGVQLGDQDVEGVIQKVILRKKATAQDALRAKLDAVETEIARQLPDATIRYHHADHARLLANYPILPARWRLWDACLRAVDRAGVTAKLRNQLKLTHEAARATADLPLGHVVGADFIVHNQQTELLNTGILSREVHDKLARWRQGDETDKLKARVGALCFVLARLPRDAGSDIQVYATPSNLADLLVTDLDAGAKTLRADVEGVLHAMVADGDLMLVGTEYRWQTRESASWHHAFQEKVNQLKDNAAKFQQARADLLKGAVQDALKKLKITQGLSAEARAWKLHVGDALPKAEGEVPVWLRDEWTSTFETARAQAQALGVNDPTVVVLLPKLHDEALRKHLTEREAAEAVLAAPPTLAQSGANEREEAEKSMHARAAQARDALQLLLREILSKARILRGGGTEVAMVAGDDAFFKTVEDAVRQGVQRLYPRFGDADSAKWDTISKAALKGDADAFAKHLSFNGDLLQHKVVDAILKEIGAGRTGKDLRTTFTSAPYGWAQEAVDATVYTLLAAGQLRAADNNAPVALKDLNNKRFSSATFKREKVVATAVQKGTVKSLVSALGISPTAGQEASDVGKALQLLKELAAAGGSEAPRPAPADTTLLTTLSKFVEQELIVETAREANNLLTLRDALVARRDGIAKRLPAWEQLQRLIAHARGRVDLATLEAEAKAVCDQRLLLQDPDPVAPLRDAATQALRDALNDLAARAGDAFAKGEACLAADPLWAKLDATDQSAVRAQYQVVAAPTVKAGSASEVLHALDARSLDGWATLIDAIPTRFAQCLAEAARRSIPTAKRIALPGRTLSSPAELDAWLDELRALLAPKLAEHPVIVG